MDRTQERGGVGSIQQRTLQTSPQMGSEVTPTADVTTPRQREEKAPPSGCLPVNPNPVHQQETQTEGPPPDT